MTLSKGKVGRRTERKYSNYKTILQQVQIFLAPNTLTEGSTIDTDGWPNQLNIGVIYHLPPDVLVVGSPLEICMLTCPHQKKAKTG